MVLPSIAETILYVQMKEHLWDRCYLMLTETASFVKDEL